MTIPTPRSMVAGQCRKVALQKYLNSNKHSGIGDAIEATGLSKKRIERMTVWQDHLEVRLEAYLKDHPNSRAVGAVPLSGRSPLQRWWVCLLGGADRNQRHLPASVNDGVAR